MAEVVSNLYDDDEVLEYDDSEFEDAEEIPVMTADVDFEGLIDNANMAVHYFFNNHFEDARKILEPWAKSSMYHALGFSVFEFLEAMMTFEHKQIQKASAALKTSLAVCSSYRLKTNLSNTLGKMVRRTNYEQFTPEQAHAELCFAESLLLKAMLSFVEDESLVSFIKAGLRIRSCYNTYKECNMILKTNKWTNKKLAVHYESGVKMGIGAFNLMISLLPSRAKKLLEFIGFSGSRKLGLEELEQGCNLKNGIRQILCVMMVLAYNLIVTYTISHREGDLVLCEKILKEELALYPKGVWFLFFKGRLELMKGNLKDSQDWYKESWGSQSVWPQFHHLCFWELMWSYSLMQDWRQACLYAGYLLTDSKWSRTIYSYQKASILLMMGDSLSDDERQEVNVLMRKAPNYKQRIAGKSLPMEKFAIRRTERYFAQDKWLCLPVIELMYIWNFFRVLGKRLELIQNVHILVERELKTLDTDSEYYEDNRCLLELLRGACLRHMKANLQAEEAFKTVLGNAKKIKEDSFLVPFAIVELSQLELDRCNYQKASYYLEDAKRNYAGYSLESRLHFRIHAIHSDLLEKDKTMLTT
ncbi:hypothetical protein RUM43_013038 [Polyplax serrata]|uniref:Tetratricopeptide repeat protein 39B n=1 Tax=Polyplax serrata TaxID=468196 RepID=A0AAN8NQR3_POLSC